MKYKIALIGMMGSGKSSISKILGKELNIEVFEMDELFEKKENISIKDFFKLYGEEVFREKETKLLKELSKKDEFILSTGGGIILKEINREILFNKNITTVYLEASVENIFERIKNQNNRPLLMVENPKQEIEKIINQRKKYYNQAQIKIDTNNKDKETIAKEIKEKLWKI